MKKDLQIHRIPHNTDEWYEFRQNGIGGSEVGTVLGINRWDTAVRLYHEKIDTIPQRRETSERMFWGQAQEKLISNIWQYYDGTPDGYVENAIEGRIIRKCRPINAYITNPKYPWLFASVDRLINVKGGYNLITGEPLQKEGILEIKSMSYWMKRMWEDGVPISYLAQIHQYMAILETDYAEIAMLVDSGNLVIEKIQRDDELTERILQITHDWWYDRVLPAREAKLKRDEADIKGDIVKYEQADAILQKLEPPPYDSEAYKEFMEESFERERDTVDGTMELYSQAKRDNFLKKMRGRIDKERTGIKNLFIKFLHENGAEAVDFGRLGMVSWSQRKGSDSRTFNNRTKEVPDDEDIEREFQKLDQNV